MAANCTFRAKSDIYNCLVWVIWSSVFVYVFVLQISYPMWAPTHLKTPSQEYQYELPTTSESTTFVNSAGFVYEINGVRSAILQGISLISACFWSEQCFASTLPFVWMWPHCAVHVWEAIAQIKWTPSFFHLHSFYPREATVLWYQSYGTFLSHVSVLSKRLNRSSWISAWGPSFDLLYTVRISTKIVALPVFVRRPKLWTQKISPCMAHRSSKHVVIA